MPAPKSYVEDSQLFCLDTTLTRDYGTATITPIEIIGINADGNFIVRSTGLVAATGTARKNPEDAANQTISRELAGGRALANLGRRFIKHADGLVKHADDIAQMKTIQKHKREGKKNTAVQRPVLGPPKRPKRAPRDTTYIGQVTSVGAES